MAGNLIKPILRSISGRWTAPGASFTGITPVSGDSFTMPASGGKILFTGLWAKFQAAGIVRIHGQGLGMANDNDGFRFNTITGQPYSYMPDGVIPNDPQDIINVDAQGSAVAGDIELLTIEVMESNGIDKGQNLINWQDLVKRQAGPMLSWSYSITGVATGNWGGDAAFNTGTSVFFDGKTDYAIVGYAVNTPFQSIGFYGPGTGLYKVAAPAFSTDKELTRRYWQRKSQILGGNGEGVKCIVVVNGADMQNTFITALCDENGGTFLVNLFLVPLR